MSCLLIFENLFNQTFKTHKHAIAQYEEYTYGGNGNYDNDPNCVFVGYDSEGKAEESRDEIITSCKQNKIKFLYTNFIGYKK
jgi:hypothetical protein